jgi:hypothetical protein
LRRLKQQVAQELPPRVEERVDCVLTPGQRRFYLSELGRARAFLGTLLQDPQGLERNRMPVLATLTRLRQICCHPALAGGRDGLGSGKFEALFELLEPLLEEGHKVLLFSQFVECLKLIEAELERRGVPYHLLTGQTTRREKVVSGFTDDPKPCVFLLSLRAGGLGLNLTAASYVILFRPVVESGDRGSGHRPDPSHRPDENGDRLSSAHRGHGGGAHLGAAAAQECAGEGPARRGELREIAVALRPRVVAVGAHGARSRLTLREVVARRPPRPRTPRYRTAAVRWLCLLFARIPGTVDL